MFHENLCHSLTDLIYPCPFSKGYGIPAQQARLLLKIFLIYRLILAGMFIMLFYGRFGSDIHGTGSERLFIFSSVSYLLLTLLSIFCLIRRSIGYTIQAQILIFTDIVLITLIMHACGGINSGVGILLAASIAAGGVLIGGRCAMLFAAIASLAILAEQLYAIQTHSFKDSAYSYAGMLGASFFTIAMLSYVLAQRTEQSAEQQQTITRLEELNQYIIQHLQSGIVITDNRQQIQMSNEAALRLTRRTQMPATLSAISTQLATAFANWQTDPSQDFAVVQLPNETEIQTRFTLLPTRKNAFHMVILEDIALYNQRLQQSKLASLGQLTASIAHEIRNPLGAISHAGQLLGENPDLSPEDRRLTEIIRDHSIRVNKIIEDILQLSRRSASIRKKIPLSEWLENYIQRFVLENGLAPDTIVKTIETDNSCAFVDPDHLQQILDNLCANALKYSPVPPGTITLAIRNYEQSPCIEVIDPGPCISTSARKHLFEPFFTTSENGTGLGLYISRELAELNQARLSYYITGEGKNCFRLCLPNAEQTVIEI
ncbi:MAG: two-component system sensor histidine kinase PilS [Methylomicrobium sp.]